jgi:hypothetical protein
MYDIEKWIDVAVALGVWKGPAVERGRSILQGEGPREMHGL